MSSKKRDSMIKLQGEVCEELKFIDETKFTAMNLLDSFLQFLRVKPCHHDIFNVAVLRLAAKLCEDTNTVFISQFIFVF